MSSPDTRSVVVPLAPHAAFDLFTGDLARWWPVARHSLSARDGGLPRTVEIEPRKGGKIREVHADGASANWATITGWEPGSRLSLDWYAGGDPADATRVELRFLPDDGGTRVEVIHGRQDFCTAQARPRRTRAQLPPRSAAQAPRMSKAA